MNIISLVKYKTKGFYIFLVISSIANSVFFNGILYSISSIITKDEKMPIISNYGVYIFSFLLIGSFLVRRAFQKKMEFLTSEIIFNFETSLIENIRKTDLETFEKIGSYKLYAIIEDTKTLAQVPNLIITSFNSLLTILSVLGYITWVNYLCSLIIFTLIIILGLFYNKMHEKLKNNYMRLRSIQETYYRQIGDLLNGFKEIKMNYEKNNNLMEAIFSNKQNGKQLEVYTNIKYAENEMIGNYSWYIVIAVIIYILPKYLKINEKETSTIILALLFMKGSLDWIIYIIPQVNRLKSCIDRVNQFESTINNAKKSELNGYLKLKNNLFNKIELKNIEYAYESETNKQFKIDPISLTIRQGEIIFITGGNGSGKSTFINLLSGLYYPFSGQLLLNEKIIEYKDYTSYCSNISAIFTTPHLFSENYDKFNLKKENKKLNEYILLMKLNNVIEINESENNIVQKLSKGQQKRLCLIYALLEEKPIIILDEWAAEQDPEFREYFYECIIPELKKRGKTIIAVTHDQQYFKCADRLIRFDYGTIIEDKPLNKSFSVDGKY